MAFDRDEILASQKDRQQTRRFDYLPSAKLIAAAAPIMGAVTTSEHWNRYLEILQGFLEKTKVQAETARLKLSASDIWGHHDLLKLKSDVLVAEAMMMAWEVAINLPKAIMEGKEQALTLISEFEAKNESAGQTQ